MSTLTARSQNTDESQVLSELIRCKNDFELAKLQLDVQLKNPKNGSYGASPEYGTLQAFHFYASAKKDYDEALEALLDDFEYY